MNVKKMRIRTKFNLLMICVILFLGTVIVTIAKSRIEKSMMGVFEERVKIEAEMGMNIFDETYPGKWHIDNGELYKGNIKVNDNNDKLEEIGKITGGIVNIFHMNSTVATNIVVNGERRIGAEADSEIAEVVLENDGVYVGEADISGKLHITMYQPIKDESGQIVGMWLAGSPIGLINTML